MIELAVLGLLRDGDLHGYELKKRLRELLGPLSSVSFGSLYPALARLEEHGAVEAVSAAPAAATPPTGSLTGEVAALRTARRLPARGTRGRKVYRLTAAGAERLCELIADPSDDDRAFPVKLAFCRWCDAAARLDLLERRRAALVERLREGRRTISGTRIDRYVRSLVEHDAESTERDIAWLDRLISDERSALADDHERPALADHQPHPIGGTP